MILHHYNSATIYFQQNCWEKKKTENEIYPCISLSQTSPGFYMSAIQILKKHCGKGEIARNEHFLLFPTVFSNLSDNFRPLLLTVSAKCKSNICHREM